MVINAAIHAIEFILIFYSAVTIPIEMQSFGGNLYINMMLFEFFNIIGNLISATFKLKEKLNMLFLNGLLHLIFIFKNPTNQSPIFLILMLMIQIAL